MYSMYAMPRAQGCAGAAIVRLTALIPKPGVNLTRFHGVFAPNSKYRALVTPARRGRGNKARVADGPPTPAERRVSMTSDQVRGRLWAQRLKRVFNFDIEICSACSACSGAMKVIACIEDSVVMPKALAALAGQALQKILAHLKHKDEPQDADQLPDARTPPQASLVE